jgi:hypothetical protein
MKNHPNYLDNFDAEHYTEIHAAIAARMIAEFDIDDILDVEYETEVH